MIVIFSSGETWVIINGQKQHDRLMVDGDFVCDGKMTVGLVNRIFLSSDVKVSPEMKKALLKLVEGNEKLITII
jgi:hypothetical protein